MSFTTDVADELLHLSVKKNCCRRALLLGMLFSAEYAEEECRVRFYHEETAYLTQQLLNRIFHVAAEPMSALRVGRQIYELTFSSSAVSSFLRAAEEGREAAHVVAGFRCGSCTSAFLRGVFLSCGTVSDPHKSYHLEFRLPNRARADFLSRFLTGNVGRPGVVVRNGKIGLYYKSNGAISDLLYVIGCSGTGFDVTNVSIERDIRNDENRATNCVARNISRSVHAAGRQKAAIEHLIATKKIESLSEELRYTAELRLQNESASLAELALLHEPPISKSGLNFRLTKIMQAAEEA